MSHEMSTVENLLSKIDKKENVSYAVRDINGRTGNKYKIVGVKLKKTKFPSFVMCTCLGYKYHKKCWHSTKLNKFDKGWLHIKLKWKNI